MNPELLSSNSRMKVIIVCGWGGEGKAIGHLMVGEGKSLLACFQ